MPGGASRALDATPRVANERSSDLFTYRLREVVSASLALLVTLGTLFVAWQTFTHVDTLDSFTRGKDLLLVLSPFMGLALGYYFNKATTEARAEHAEEFANRATLKAGEALRAQGEAEVDKRQALRSATTRARRYLDATQSRYS